MNKRVYQHYVKQVRSLLPCGPRKKVQIMAQFTSSLSVYQSEHPEADYSQLIAHFGTPEEIAAACVESTGTVELLRMLRIRRRIIAVVAGSITAMFLLWAAILVVNSILLYPEERGYFIVTTEELPEGTVVEDESISLEEVG